MIRWLMFLLLLAPLAAAQPVGNVPYSAFPNCADTGGQHLNINRTTGALSCGTSTSGGSGTVTGPVSSTVGHFATWNNTGGTVLQDGGAPAASATTDTTNAANISSGTLPGGRLPALTGDVTMTAGTTSTTLAAGNASNLNNGTLAAARGGAGTISGALKGNGAGLVSQAACADLSNGAASCSTDTTNAGNISSGTLAAARGGAGTVSGALKGSGAGVVSQAACADLSNGATGCSTATGTSGATIPLLNGANTWSGVQSFNSGDLALKGATSGTLTVNAAATAGTSTLTLPGGTTDLSATGGTSQVLKQTSAGGALTVARLACADLSNAATSCSTDTTSATNITSGTLPIAQLPTNIVDSKCITFDSTTSVTAQTISYAIPWTSYTITKLQSAVNGGGSFTANIKIGSTSVTSLSAVSVSGATNTNTSATGANTGSANDIINVVISSPSGTVNQAYLCVVYTHSAN